MVPKLCTFFTIPLDLTSKTNSIKNKGLVVLTGIYMHDMMRYILKIKSYNVLDYIG